MSHRKAISSRAVDDSRRPKQCVRCGLEIVDGRHVLDEGDPAYLAEWCEEDDAEPSWLQSLSHPEPSLPQSPPEQMELPLAQRNPANPKGRGLR